MVYLVAAVLGAHVLALLILGFREETPPADVVIVLGNQVYPDGTLSPLLAQRMDAAIPLVREGTVGWMMVSGGYSAGSTDEASAMARYAEARGVPADRIVTDSMGHNTRATAKNAVIFARSHHWETAIVATSWFHIPRTRYALEAEGVDVIGQAPAGPHGLRDVYSVFREIVGGYAYVFGFRN